MICGAPYKHWHRCDRPARHPLGLALGTPIGSLEPMDENRKLHRQCVRVADNIAIPSNAHVARVIRFYDIYDFFLVKLLSWGLGGKMKREIWCMDVCVKVRQKSLERLNVIRVSVIARHSLRVFSMLYLFLLASLCGSSYSGTACREALCTGQAGNICAYALVAWLLANTQRRMHYYKKNTQI
jgi:hypothetical protein